MAGDEKDRNWDKEMAEVDRLLKKLPYAEPTLGRGSGGGGGGGEPTVRKPAVSAAPVAAAGAAGGERLGTWTRLILGLLVGIGMTQWPYTHGCGLRLIFYLIGVGAVVAAGVWSSFSSWRRRLGLAHILSQLLIVWGLALVAREVLPRVGYAKVSLPWLCPDITQPK